LGVVGLLIFRGVWDLRKGGGRGRIGGGWGKLKEAVQNGMKFPPRFVVQK